MYTITYILGDNQDYGTKIAGEHFFRLKMEFTVNTTGTNETRFGRDYGIHLIDIGELEIGRELSKNLLAVSEYNFAIQDIGYESEGAIVYELRQLLLEGALAKYVDKKALITVEVLYYGDSYPNFTTDFTGYLTKKSLRRLGKNGAMKLTALPRTNILKNKYLHDDKGIAYNPLNYVSQETGGKVIWGRSVVGGYLMNPKLTEFITDIFKLINPDVTVNFSHNWEFLGYNGVTTRTFNLEDLYLGHPYPTAASTDASNIIGQIFGTYNDFYGLVNIDDVLKKTAFIFGCVTGMETNETAIFKQINVYDESNTQTLGLVKDIDEGFEDDDIEGVRIVSRKFVKSGKNKNMYEEENSKSIEWTVPDDIAIRGSNVIDEEIFVEGNLSTDDYPSNLWAIHESSVYQIQSYNTPDRVGRVDRPGNVGSMAIWLAIFYWNLLNGWSTNRGDKLTVEGLKYSYGKDFAYGGNGYQILKMRKRYKQNETIFNALYVKDIVSFDGAIDTPPRPNYNKYLPAGFLNSLEYNSVVLAANANDGSVTIFQALAGMRVKQIYMIWSEAFNNVTALWVTDSDGTLKPVSETNLIWTYAGAVLEINVWKTYTSDQDIVLHFTTSATVTTGIVECTTELSTRS